ncbi:MAG: aminotransferase class V-fold PLP-dependent enzyme [Bryobacteraceae bacterium]
MNTDWASIRGEFPALETRTYLDTASFGQLARRTTDAVARHFARRNELACADFLNWFDDADEVRRQIARLIAAEPDDIAFTPNTSTGLATVINGIEWTPGDRVVTLAGEFPNFLYLPELLKRSGAQFVEASRDGFYDAIYDHTSDARTRLVVVSSVNYTDGFRAPLKEMGRFLHSRGVLFFVDGTQSVGALKFDVRDLQVDALAVHGYKWLLSPTGAGFLYMRRELRQRIRPSIVGWHSHTGWRAVEHLHRGTPELAASASKYEGGMLAFPEVYAMGASVGMMLEIGVDAIEQRVLRLAAQLRTVLKGVGAEVPAADSPIVAARFQGVDASPLVRRLEERGVLVSARHGSLRVSPHFYNDGRDVERFEVELRRVISDGCGSTRDL